MVCLIASTRGSRAACRTNASTDVANESYGWCTRTSPARSTRNRSGLGVPGREDGLGLRGPRLVLQVGPFERVHVPQAREVEQARRRRPSPGGDGELARQHVEDVVGHRRVDFEANGNTELRAAVQHRLDRLEEVLGLVVELEVGVSGHPEGVVRQHLHPGEQPVEMRGDHLLEGDEALAIGERDEAGERRRDLARARSAPPASPGRGRLPRGSATGSRCRGTDAPDRPQAA